MNKEIQEQIDKLKKQIHILENWSKVPIDALISVWNRDAKVGVDRYFAGIAENGNILAWENGATSHTTECAYDWENAKIIHPEMPMLQWKKNTTYECPLEGSTKIIVKSKRGLYEICRASDIHWANLGNASIDYYAILQ